ncbi:MAG: diguanylate cyclase [Candidatus Hydrogenedentes bacterium]|nr:diguanylate cyclase [Candidatus Hydrogenedentota bacterium]
MVTAIDILNAKILLVDDLEANVRLLERTLRGAGYVSVASTMNPREVCELHRKNRYDLIMLDLQMPGMDGFEVMAGLKEIEAGGYLPVLVVTVNPGHKLHALQAGAKDFVSKPLELVEVQARVYNMLEVRLLHQEARNYSKALESLALHDPLTGLANRRLLVEKASLAIAHARRNKSSMAVVYVDLDGFKSINDTWGHDAGDILLKMTAERLVAAVRQEDTVSRLGGDEFVIALWQIRNADDAARVGSKLMEAMLPPFSIQGRVVDITASAGLGIYPAHGEDVETLMKSADLALYDAKRAGKNAYQVSERTNLSATVSC